MCLILVFSPLFGFFSAGLFGRFLGSRGSALITTFCLAVSAFLSIFFFFEIGLFKNSAVYLEVGSWVTSESLQLNWGFLFDSLTAIMCLIVTSVSFLVHVYSVEYMSHDPHFPRFMSYLSLFTFFMLILVTADNLLQMFLGWEGVGLCSYLLINFWFTRVQANKAAIKAMLLNRVGDFCLMVGILLLFTQYKSLDYSLLAAMTPVAATEPTYFLIGEFYSTDLICVFFFLGAMGKSAQLGLHTWLPDAMEGPTPVSALIHAATMVTAGVFLLARCSFLYEHSSPFLTSIITIVGASTAFFAASVALLQNDIKRVIAYSTCSQLGYMVMSCGSSDYSAGIYHLFNHAFFKALLFLGAGSVIHAICDQQDLRRMGGLFFMLPATYVTMQFGSLALMGFPFLSGFYSKDMILELAYGSFSNAGHYSYWMGAIGAFLTSFYSARLLQMVFINKPEGYKHVITFASDNYNLSKVLGFLSIPTLLAGYFAKDSLVGLGSDFFSGAVDLNPGNQHALDSEFLSHYYKTIPLVFSLSGLNLALFLYSFEQKFLFAVKVSHAGRKIYRFLNRKWFFDKLYNEFLGQLFFKASYSISYKLIDKGVLEMLGPRGVSHVVLKSSYIAHKSQSFSLYHYSLIFASFITGILGINCFNVVLQEDPRMSLILGFLSLLNLYFLKSKSKVN